MAKNIFQNPTQAANLAHYGHPMSQTKKFSSTVGEIRPLYMDFLYPNETVKGKVEVQTIMEALKNPSFVDIETCIDAFFVPIEQLYQPFKDIYYGINDIRTSFIEPDDFDLATFPYFSFGDRVYQEVLNTSHSFYSNFYSSPDHLVSTVSYDTLRLLDALEFPVSTYGTPFRGNFAVKDTHFSPWFVLAYQKIWYDVYRITDLDENDPCAYNVDEYYSDPVINPSDKGKLKMHYIPYGFDYYTHFFVSPFIPNGRLFSGSNDMYKANLLGVDLSPLYAGAPGTSGQYATNHGSNPVSPTGGAMSDTWRQRDPGDNMDTTNPGGITPQNLRAMFAMEKVAEVTRRAGKHVDAQTLAHFGVSSPDQIAGHVVKLGHWSNLVDMKRIVSQSAAEGEPLGTMAGTGDGTVRSGDIYYKTNNNFGVFMVVMYSRPKLEYFQTGLSPLWQLTSPDKFYRPEYGKLGMMPHYAFNIIYHPTLGMRDDFVATWVYRDWASKVKPNLALGSFAGTYRDWTIARVPGLSTAQSASLQSFRDNRYVSPADLDAIMEIAFRSDPYDGDDVTTWSYSRLYETDPMKHKSYAEFIKTSTMPTFGLPDL